MGKREKGREREMGRERRREREGVSEREKGRERRGERERVIKTACPPCSFATFIVAFLICMQEDLDGSAQFLVSVVSADSPVRNSLSLLPFLLLTHKPPSLYSKPK